MKVIDSIDRVLAKIEEIICLILLTAMICVVALQVLNQALLHIRSIVWTEEVSRILFVWSIMIGGSLAVRKGDHLTVDFIYTRFKGKARSILRVIILLICVATCAYITRSGVFLVQTNIKRGNFFGVTLWPTWVASISVPIGFALMTIRYIMILVKESIEEFRRPEAEQEGGEI